MVKVGIGQEKHSILRLWVGPQILLHHLKLALALELASQTMLPYFPAGFQSE
jgi:hypothetical protein